MIVNIAVALRRRADSVRLSSIGAGLQVPHLRHLMPEIRQRSAAILVGLRRFSSLTSMFVWHGVCSIGMYACTTQKFCHPKGNLDETSEAYSVLILPG